MAEKRVVILDSGAPIAERLREVKVGDTTGIDVKLQAATGDEVAVNIQYETDKAAGNDTGLVVNQTNTSSPGVSKAIDIQQGGVSKASFSPEGKLNLPIETGAAALPTLSFGDGDTGFFESGDDTLGVSFGGAQRYLWNATSIRGTVPTGFELVTLSSATEPALTFFNDSDTGLGNGGADILSMIAGAVEGIRVTETAGAIVVNVTGVATLITGHTIAGLPTPATGMIARITDGDGSLAWGATAVNSGAGATPYMVWYNGTNWTVMGK